MAPKRVSPRKVAKKRATASMSRNYPLYLDTAIHSLEKTRNSKVIVYITGDRQPHQLFRAVVHSDVLPYFRQILKKINHTSKITLAIYTNGGRLETPWPLVNLIREHCDEFEVVVLSKALSAGTMIALGADKIVMTRYAHLSPIDPAADVADEKNNIKHFEIEDIIGYIDFLRDKIGLTEQATLGEMAKDLTREINPTLLGSVNRTHSLVRRLAKNLLGLHKEVLSERQSKEIVEHLTQKLFSHTHLINYREAKQIGFDNVVELPDEKNEKAIENLLDAYSKYLELDSPFDLNSALKSEKEKTKLTSTRATIHSSDSKFDFQSQFQLTKIPDPAGNTQINVSPIGIGGGWIKL